ncbi:aminotransferase class V-fold PLP-dependent enzyme [Lentzea kentuckyensis]|uniref:aminotransferase class V-fold PLP-dependent enzyme n=1 Tax=Lentzea kentuckyensis TaxID=360086 RepID=UPI0013026BE9|nr:aminotransferase class V-fold PLP-dependent enzyme [Lentzea kentuckyensis]
MRRRALLTGGTVIAASALLPATASASPFDPGDWSSVRRQFRLSHDYLQFSAYMLSAQSAPVREAVAKVRDQLDVDPYLHGLGASDINHGVGIRAALADHLGGAPGEVALTDSATMGIGLLYSGLGLAPGDDVVTTEHDFYATHEALRLKASTSGAVVRRIRLYDDPAAASTDRIVGSLIAAIRPETRALALTWVHSSTGVKLPLAEIAAALRPVNAERPPAHRVLLCVDGVHGFGAQDVTVARLGCDFFISSLHKWMFGPRGTGFVWGTEDAWRRVTPVVPSFSIPAILGWIEGKPPVGPPGELNTPGGYHTFENRWAVPAALDFHRRIGQARIAGRVVEQASRLKAALSEMRHVRLITPRDPALSAGLVCFEVDGFDSTGAVERLFHQHQVAATDTPYRPSYVRMGPSIVTTPREVDRAAAAVARLRP